MTALINHPIWQKLWKIYFWSCLVFIIFRYLYGFVTSEIPMGIAVDALIFNILFLLAVFGLAYREKIFSAFFWKIFLLVFVLYDIYKLNSNFSGIQRLLDSYPASMSWTAVSIIAVFVIISYFAVYLYAFKLFKEIDKNAKRKSDKSRWMFTPFIKRKG